MKKYAIFSTIVILLLSANVYSKPFNTDKEKLQTAVKKAINIAYPSTVSIRGAGEFSGVVVSAEGHVLTAAHAARPNQKYEVIFPDGNLVTQVVHYLILKAKLLVFIAKLILI